MNGAENFSDISENEFQGNNDSPRARNPREAAYLKEALPVVVFKRENYKNTTEDNKDKLTCSICFCDFDDNDKIRPL
jgi:hypothetical protein